MFMILKYLPLKIHEDQSPPQQPINNDVEDNGVKESVLGGARTSFIHHHHSFLSDKDAIRVTVNDEDPLNWPTTERKAVN